MSWEDGLKVHTLTSKLSSLGLNLSPAINCHSGVSQAGCLINVRDVPRIEDKRVAKLQITALTLVECQAWPVS